MSSRVTRSSARKSADSAPSDTIDLSNSTTVQPSQSTKKRKASRPDSKLEPEDNSVQAQPSSSPKAKRRKSKADPFSQVDVESLNKKTRFQKQTHKNMPTSPGQDGPPSPPGPSTSSKRKSSKAKKVSSPTEPSSSSAKPSFKPPKSSKKRVSGGDKKDKDIQSDEPVSPENGPQSSSPKDDTSDELPALQRDDEASFLEEALGAGSFPRSLGAFGPYGGGSAVGAYMSSVMTHTRDLLNNLKAKDDLNTQLDALSNVSEMLLMSNEDNLNGQFNADAFVKEFVRIAGLNPEEDPELAVLSMEKPDHLPRMRLLACRCIANLIEALPSATAAVVYNGSVPMLISKLMLSDDFDIELAEQALTTLEKISSEFPSAIVREGGLSALLQNLDFFTSSVQRTGVTAAANCCRNIPEDSFSTIKEFMPRLRDVLNGSDQKVVEQGSLCVTRIFDSFKGQDENIEQLMDADLLRVILRLLLPGSSNFISPAIHTQFLRVLSATARASPTLTKELFKMDITDTLYQILTGVSAPSQDENVASNIDSVVVMQALIHRPRDQVFETLKVICELLPGMDGAKLGYLNDLIQLSSRYGNQASAVKSSKAPIDKRLKLLRDCKTEMKRFATVLFPTLTDAYSSTVNLQVRQHVLTAQLKMLCNLELDILEEALRPVPYASHLASILSQKDHMSLVTMALQAAELLIQRLSHVYRYQFHREGVIAEVRKLANRPLTEPAQSEAKKDSPKTSKTSNTADPIVVLPSQPTAETEEVETSSREDMSISEDTDHDHEDDDDENHDDEDDEAEEIEADMELGDEDDDGASSEDSDNEAQPPIVVPATDTVQDVITRCARKFISQYETKEGSKLRDKASQALDDLNGLVQSIADCYGNGQGEDGAKLFSRLAKSFEGNALESITSYELLSSKVVHTLVDIFDTARGQANLEARAAFIAAFMSSTASNNVKKVSTASPSTPFSILVQKLQDLLSRSEHFEVITVNSNAHDNHRGSPSSALSKHIRIRLVADGDESGLSSSFRTIMVSIHAIATLKSLDEYLRPRIATGERARAARSAGSRVGDAAPPNLTESMRSVLATRDSFLSRRLASTPNPLNGSTNPPPAAARSSSARRAPHTPKSPGESEAVASQSSTSTSKPRRSSRKTRSQPAQPPQPPQPSTPPASTGAPSLAPPDSQNTLECADEAQMSDEDEELDPSELMADMHHALAGSPPEPEPSAVNVDVTPSGAVTTHEDNQSPASSLSTGHPPLGSLRSRWGDLPPNLPPHLARHAERILAAHSLGLAHRPSSYAAAAASTPTDWHLEFSANGRSIPADMTIYKAIHTSSSSLEDISGRSVWMNTHTIQFKKVNGPPPEPESLSSRPVTPPESSSSLPESLKQNPVTATILRLLKILHEINGTIDEVLGERSKSLHTKPEPLTQFVNTKLTAKMNRQLEEPLIVASKSLPSWSEDLARIYPFLFPFETRHLFLQSTSFGYGRSMQRWLNAQEHNDSSRHRHRDDRPLLGRIQRQKVRIQRQRFLESAVKVMESYGSNNSILEVEYFEEVGTGLGPTLEFYSSASKEFCRRKLKLWRENESDGNSEYAFGKHGLFPMPMTEAQLKTSNGEKVLKLFSALGKFVARSMLDSRIIDVSFNPMFFRWGTGTRAMPHTIGTLKIVDEDLAKSLVTLKQFDLSRKKILEQKRLTNEQKNIKLSGIRVANAAIDDLGLNFTLPGYPAIELIENGKNIDVNIHNVGSYVEYVINFTLASGVRSQIESFRKGFSEVFPYDALRAFTSDELVMLFGRVDEDWSMETLTDSIKADHGYNLDSRSVRNLLQAMTDFNAQERRDFLQFVTGSPKLPIGGFKALTPMFTVVLRSSEPGHHADEYLPSCMTCVNYLKLPDYSDLNIMKMKLNVATQEGQGAFHLS